MLPQSVQQSQLFKRFQKKPAAFVCSGRSNAGASEDVGGRLGRGEQAEPSSLASPGSFMVLQILRSLRCSHIGTSSSLLPSFAAFQTSVWRMTLAKLLLPRHVASAWKAQHLRLKVLEGSSSSFFFFFFLLGVLNAAGSDGVCHWQAERRSLSRLKKMTDLLRQCLCQSLHICGLVFFARWAHSVRV